MGQSDLPIYDKLGNWARSGSSFAEVRQDGRRRNEAIGGVSLGTKIGYHFRVTRQIILSSRLKLVPSTQALLGLEMDDMQAFAKLLGASIAEDWPPGEYDRDAMQFFIDKLQEGGADAEGWYGWYAIRQATQTEPATLIGTGGYLGPPDQTGTVELGYSISERWRGQGLAQELVTALVDNALKSGATKIIAHTVSDNPASIAVLRRCGFLPAPSTDSCRLRFDYSPSL